MSKPPSQNITSLKGAHTRNLSGNPVPKQDFKVPKRPSVLSKPEIHYTALIRLPFARGDFVDPPQVDWNATKDRALWKIISRSPKTSELDWEDLATKFHVSPTFMLQQAAWLYERHLSHVRAQMKKVGSSNATNSGSGSAHAAVGGVSMKRLGSGGAGASKTPSALSIRSRDSPIPRGDTSTPGTPRTAAPPLSRTPSTNTVTQSRAHLPAASPRAHLHRSFRSSFPPPQKPTPPPALSPPIEPANQPSDPASPATSALSSSTSDSSSEEDTNNPLHRSQLFKRPPRFRAQKPRGLANLDDEDHEGDDEDDSNTFLPFAHTSRLGTAAGDAASPTTEDPSATLRDKILQPPEHVQKYLAHDTNKAPVSATFAQGQGKDKGKGKGKEPAIASSATSSASDAPSRGGQGFSPSALSPRHRAELARLSPGKSVAGGKREGSDGTPSMGSSFSDLDDASITQSALEEALLSNIQHGRMSTLSQLRSRYL